jgi:hypothetical protein
VEETVTAMATATANPEVEADRAVHAKDAKDREEAHERNGCDTDPIGGDLFQGHLH